MLVASPHYLAACGTPQAPGDLKEHASVFLGRAGRWELADGTTITPKTCHRLNDGEAMRLALESGMGIGEKAAWNAYASLRSGALVEVLPHFPLVTKSAIWALHPTGRLMPARVRAMIDHLENLCSPVPPWERANES